MARRKIGGPVTELNTEDLNAITRTGTYVQSSNYWAKRSDNYPRAVAGLLEVYTGGGFTFQRYTAYKDFGVYTRSHYGYEDAWSPWQRILTE